MSSLPYSHKEHSEPFFYLWRINLVQHFDSFSIFLNKFMKVAPEIRTLQNPLKIKFSLTVWKSETSEPVKNATESDKVFTSVEHILLKAYMTINKST